MILAPTGRNLVRPVGDSTSHQLFARVKTCSTSTPPRDTVIMATVALETAAATAATADFEMIAYVGRGRPSRVGNESTGEMSLDDDDEDDESAQGDVEAQAVPVGAEDAPRGPGRARRLQRAVRDIIREHYLCFVLVWLLLVLALAIATFVTFIEMLIVFQKHHDDPCDEPLNIFIWINMVTFAYHNTLHLCIQRWLGYDPSLYNTDEPVPEAVRRIHFCARSILFPLFLPLLLLLRRLLLLLLRT